MSPKDFVKERKDLYLPGKEPVIVDVPAMLFLMADGEGAPDPDSGSADDVSEFQKAVGALYGIVYSIKMSYRRPDIAPEGYYNFKVPPLEGLWWMTNGKDFDLAQPEMWHWTLMVRVPEFVTEDDVRRFANIMIKKKRSDIYRRVRLEKYREGLSVQIMHIGPYDAEGPNIAKMHKYALDQDYKLRGKHHELYYGDPRRSAPEKLKTVLRQPIKK